MALQRGTVDGAIFPAYSGISYKLFEVAKYHSWPPIYPLIGANLLVNLNAWNKLPKEYQEILQEEVNKIDKYTYEVSGPELEKLAQKERNNLALKLFGFQTQSLPIFEKQCFPYGKNGKRRVLIAHSWLN